MSNVRKRPRAFLDMSGEDMHRDMPALLEYDDQDHGMFCSALPIGFSTLVTQRYFSEYHTIFRKMLNFF